MLPLTSFPWTFWSFKRLFVKLFLNEFKVCKNAMSFFFLLFSKMEQPLRMLLLTLRAGSVGLGGPGTSERWRWIQVLASTLLSHECILLELTWPAGGRGTFTSVHTWGSGEESAHLRTAWFQQFPRAESEHRTLGKGGETLAPTRLGEKS